MRYQRVAWRHNDPTEPVTLFAEIDDEGWERRKVDQFEDGRLGWADEGHADEATGTALSVEPIPDLGRINADVEFDGAEISVVEFEEVWAKARGAASRDSRDAESGRPLDRND